MQTENIQRNQLLIYVHTFSIASIQAHKLGTQTPPIDYIYIKIIAQAMQNKL